MFLLKICLLYSDGDYNEVVPYDCIGRNTFLKDIKMSLLRMNHEVIEINSDKDLLQNLLKIKDDIDLVFNIADEGINLNTQLEPHVPALMDVLGIKYTGSNYISLANCLDKVIAKRIVFSENILTPKYLVFDNEIISNKINLPDLEFPLIVKPSREDGSVGIKNDSVVTNFDDLIKKVNNIIKKYNQPALVEEYIDGREISVGVLGHDDNLKVLSTLEILYNMGDEQNNIFSYECKWDKNDELFKSTPYKCPAKIDSKLELKIVNIAKKVYQLMGLKDYGRIDFRLDKDNNPYFIEANPNPDLTNGDILSMMAKKANLSYDDLINFIINSALNDIESMLCTS